MDVQIDEVPFLELACLVDTGSLRNRFGQWVADAAGVDTTAWPAESLAVGGRSTVGHTVPVRLTLAGHDWEAPVTFCDPWPWDFQLLGQEGFFRWWRVCVHAFDHELDLEPIDA